jgi:hypothetical protein
MPIEPTRLLDRTVVIADWVNPLVSRPSAPLEVGGWLASFEPSLMPRISQLQGVAGGLSVLSARAVSGLLERAMPPFAPGGDGTRRRLAIRAATGLVGATVARLPVRPDESLWRAGLRTAGRLVAVSVVGSSRPAS